MARLNVVDPENCTGKAKEIFDGPLKQKRINIFKGIANNPNVLEAFLQFAGGVKESGSLSNQEHELVALATGAANGCDYCRAAHTKVASGLGLSDEAIEDAKTFKSDDDKHQALLNFTRGIIEKKGFITNDELEQFKAAGYDDAAVVEVIGAITVNTFTNLVNHVNETEIDAVFQPAGAKA